MDFIENPKSFRLHDKEHQDNIELAEPAVLPQLPYYCNTKVHNKHT